MKDILYKDVDYCQYADWGYENLPDYCVAEKFSELPNKICDHRTCRNIITTWYGGVQHCDRLGGNDIKFFTRKNTDSPSSLVNYLLSLYALPNKAFAGWEYVTARGQPPPPAAQPQGERNCDTGKTP